MSELTLSSRYCDRDRISISAAVDMDDRPVPASLVNAGLSRRPASRRPPSALTQISSAIVSTRTLTEAQSSYVK